MQGTKEWREERGIAERGGRLNRVRELSYLDFCNGSDKSTCWLYFVSAGGKFIKIGYSRNVQHRIACLQTNSPFLLVVLGVFGTQDAFPHRIESELHKSLQQFHVRGEWFRDSPAARTIIKQEIAARRGMLFNL